MHKYNKHDLFARVESLFFIKTILFLRLVVCEQTKRSLRLAPLMHLIYVAWFWPVLARAAHSRASVRRGRTGRPCPIYPHHCNPYLPLNCELHVELHLSLSRSLPLSTAFESVTAPHHSASTRSTRFYSFYVFRPRLASVLPASISTCEWHCASRPLGGRGRVRDGVQP